jgi:hypothetical protein
MHQAPRCLARTRRGTPCQSPAMKNGRCRMHGGTSPGAPKGNQNALKHGRYTADAIAKRREIGALVKGHENAHKRGSVMRGFFIGAAKGAVWIAIEALSLST